MGKVRLTPTSYVVLGMVAATGRCTPYDLKRLLAQSVGYFWSFPHAQLYAEPARLAAAGLLAEQREQGGRNRRLYTVTPQGRSALRQWLGSPTAALGEIRDPGLLKLFFADLGSEADLAALADTQLAAHRARLVVYEGLAENLKQLPGSDVRFRPLEMGLRFERTAVEFWADVVRSAQRAVVAAGKAARPRRRASR